MRLPISFLRSFLSLLLVALAVLDAAQANDAQPGFRRGALGVTRKGTPIEFLAETATQAPGKSPFQVLMIAGLDGASTCVDQADLLLKYWNNLPPTIREAFRLTVVPCANPDGAQTKTGPANGSGGNPTRGYPPTGEAYHSATDPEAAYLWRWIGAQGPDLVLVVSDTSQEKGAKSGWFAPEFAQGTFARRLAQELEASAYDGPADGLVPQLSKSKPANVGTVPAFEYRTAQPGQGFLKVLLAALESAAPLEPSPAHQELARRLARTPLQVAEDLSRHFGHDLKEVVYIPAVALIGRLRLGELTKDDQHVKDVMRIVGPYVAGEKRSLPEKASGSHFSGHLVFAELARMMPEQTKQRYTYTSLASQPAFLAFNADGSPRASLPSHSEMSDAVFMGCPILASAGLLTGEAKYHEACLRQLRFMQKLCLREDGLYRHSPLDEAAWGRGNGFPALGLALSLDAWPPDQPGREEVLQAFQKHIAAVAAHQDADGMWHQVIDHPESYRELTATCMITYAMLRGIQNGWLSAAEYRPHIERAWQALLTRIGPDGNLIDVCTGTGKQKNLRAYYDRGAILGRDARGGAMALLVATEMAAWKAKNGEGK